MTDRVTLAPAARSYGNRCRNIGLERDDVPDLQDAMNNPRFKRAHHGLLDELARDYRLYGDAAVFPTWQNIQLATHGQDFSRLAEVVARRYDVSDWATIMAKHILGYREEVEHGNIDLVLVSLDDLGYCVQAHVFDRISRQEVYARALERGLTLCPKQVGLELRNQWYDPLNTRIIEVATKPIYINGVNFCWVLQKDRLYGREADESFGMADNRVWVFQRIRNFHRNATT